MPADPKHVRDLFLAAADLPADQRAAFLAEKCGGDGELLAAVERLLGAHEQPASVLDPSARPGHTDAYRSVTECPGTMIGSYRLMEQIGEGGFGLVFVAEQQQPVRRKVALKVIKPGMDSSQVIARFEQERQALALMDHPNIAKVLDAGATDSGRPYFVMELVRGIPITQYCDQNQLTPRERLELFVDVCHAIQHAHQKGVIHRDVKPSNVLVTSHDGKPVAKVIDFGVAKAIHQHLTERTIYTNFAQMIGTPAYMSPEQAEMSGLDIDTRSDVYSLGVLLYELLTGSTPLERKRLMKAAYDEIRRLIREEEPPRPSQRLSTSEALPSLAASRKTEPARLSRMLKGELDWVVMKALEKDRTRRYETASGLARDIQRYLADEVVEARPPSAGYRLRKFARKNRAALATAAVFALLLMAGAAVSTWQAVRATRAEVEAVAAREAEAEQRRQAEANEQKSHAAAVAEKKAKETALQREAETKAVLDFVENKVFAAARPKGEEGGLGHDVSLRAAIEAAMPFVANTFLDQPLIEARLRMTLAASLSYLGEPKAAVEQGERARALYAMHRGSGHPDTLKSMDFLADRCTYLRWRDRALKLHEEALALRKATLGPDHPETLLSMHNLAGSYLSVGRPAPARKLLEETLALRKAKLGPGHPDTLSSMHDLGATYPYRDPKRLKVQEETLALRKAKLGPEHPDTLWSMFTLALTYGALDREAESLKLFEETLSLQRARLGRDHRHTLLSMDTLARRYRALGRDDETLKLHEEILALRRAKLGPDHPETLMTMGNVANGYAQLGREAEALKIREEVVGLIRAKLSIEHESTRFAMNNLAWILATASDVKLRDPKRAVKLAEEVVRLSPKTSPFRGTLGTARYRAGDWKGSITELEEAIRLWKPDAPTHAIHGFVLAMAHWQLGEKEKARAWFDKSAAWMARGKKDDPDLKRFRAEAAELLGVKEGPVQGSK